MKKRVLTILMVTLCMCACVTGCKKEEVKEVKDVPTKEEVEKAASEAKEEIKEEKVETKPGAYMREFVEEYADGNVTCYYYLYLMEGGKGFSIAQDEVPITWKEGSITDENGTTSKFEMSADGTLKLDRSDIQEGLVEEFKYIGKDLPQDALDEMRHNLDGTLKVNDIDAGFAFDDLLTSDTISFYSLKSTVDYAAEGDDLESMKAAYIELTDKILPVLLVKTPNAPQEVGYEHVLQYVDGKIYNVVGADKIDAVYKDAAVIVASYNDTDGETTYYYKPDTNNELYVFASKNTNGENVACVLYDEAGAGNTASEEEMNAAIEDAIQGTKPLEEISWKEIGKAVPY